MQPLVTISIPVFKCEDFLVRCLESVRAQTYQNLEVTLINDQTPDNSVEIAEKYIEKYQLQNWKIYHLEENLGLSVVRNKGIETAQGKYIFFLDSDDEISDDCISNLLIIAEKTSAQMTVSQIECEHQETQKKFFCLGKLSSVDKIEGNDLVLKAFSEEKIPSSAVNKLFLTEYLKQNQLYFVPDLFAQDELWTFHLCLKMTKVTFFLEKPTYTYYLHDQSVIHNRDKRNFDNWFTIGEQINASLKEEKNLFRRNLILKYFTKYKNMTLLMNWKAQKNETLWKESYTNYKNLSALSFADYFSNNFDSKTKKADLFNRLPTNLGFKFFKWRYER
ncbi:glycosyltransferase [Halpernia sp.]|uniref:glycosyltransferase n=1 Tax=Halpernia sp. TaxID=2782209 RepID=UPI003A9477D3